MRFLFSEIGEMYNVTSSAIGPINRGVNWKFLTEDESLPIRKRRYVYVPMKIGVYNSVINEKIAKEIADMLEFTNIQSLEIAKKFGVKPGIINSINTGYSWRRSTKRDSYLIRFNVLT